MRSRTRPLAIVACLCACLAAASAAPASAAPPIKHVWLLILENENFASTFGKDSGAPYLSQTLTAQGQLLANYYGTSHNSLGNYISLISGQASNPVTQADSPLFVDMFPGAMGADGQVIGQGSVYPASAKTIADQLDAKGLTWRGYMEDMGNGPPSQAKTCRHPQANQSDPTQSARNGDQYAARHNPFVYFHSIIDDQKRCDAHDVALDRLEPDLRSAATTPNYSFITPNLCNDGHDAPCVDGRPGGLKSANEFLKAWVPKILASPAYKQGGMLIVTFDEAEASGSEGDATSCCDEPSGPNTPNPGALIVGSGGGKIGAVVLSPWVRPGSINATPYNHYGLLRSVQALFGLGPLGYSGQAGLRAFGDDVYNGTGPTAAAGCRPPKLPKARRGRLPHGSVITRLRTVRRAGNRSRFLEFRTVRNARLTAIVRRTPRRGKLLRVRSRAIRGCRVYRIGLTFRHGRISVRAAVGRAAETRTVRF